MIPGYQGSTLLHLLLYLIEIIFQNCLIIVVYWFPTFKVIIS